MPTMPDPDRSICVLPDCSQPRHPVFLGWNGNSVIWSAYCEDHGPRSVAKYCSACGQQVSARMAWPDGIQPVGESDGQISTVTPTPAG